jgi:hypothetical protein
MGMNRIACYSLFIASFVAGAVASRQSGRNPERAGPGVAPSKSVPRDSRSWTAGERMARVEEILSQPDALLESRLETRGHFAALPMEAIKRMSQAEVRNTREGDLTDGERLTARLREEAIREWCHRDPFGFLDEMPKADDIERAMAWREAARSNPSRANDVATGAGRDLGFRERTALLQGLAEGDPGLAFSAARALSDDDFDHTGVDEVAEGFADPRLRLKWANLVFERSGVKDQPALYQIFKSVADDDPDLLERSAELKVVSEYRDSIQRTVAEQRLKNLEPGSPVPYPKECDRYAGWELEGRRLARWFARDPEAVRKWIDDAPDPELRGNFLAALAGASAITDLESLDRVIEAFPEAGDRKAVMGCATYFLSDMAMGTSTPASLRNFVAKHPEARPFVKRPKLLEP